MTRNKTYKEVDKKVKKDILKKIDELEIAHGSKVFRLVANNHFGNVRRKAELEKQIAKKEEELKELKERYD